MLSLKRLSAESFTSASLVVLALCLLCAGCSDKANPPLNYYEVRLEADAPDEKDCKEAVSVQFIPIKVAPQPAGTLYQTEAYLDRPVIVGKPVEDGPGNWECWFTYRSRDLAPGRWQIVGEFNTGPQSCERDVVPGHKNRVRMDQEEGCVEHDRPGTEVDARKAHSA